MLEGQYVLKFESGGYQRIPIVLSPFRSFYQIGFFSGLHISTVGDKGRVGFRLDKIYGDVPWWMTGGQILYVWPIPKLHLLRNESTVQSKSTLNEGVIDRSVRLRSKLLTASRRWQPSIRHLQVLICRNLPLYHWFDFQNRFTIFNVTEQPHGVNTCCRNLVGRGIISEQIMHELRPDGRHTFFRCNYL